MTEGREKKALAGANAISCSPRCKCSGIIFIDLLTLAKIRVWGRMMFHMLCNCGTRFDVLLKG